MTLLDIRRELFTFFSKNDTFDLDKDLGKIFPLSEDKDLELALIKAGFAEFEEKEIVVKLIYDDKVVWALSKPLIEYSQTIELSFATVAALTDTINNICNQEGYDKGKVDPLNIKEIDIQNAILLINNFQQKGNFNE
jgi:hypothetical protein